MDAVTRAALERVRDLARAQVAALDEALSAPEADPLMPVKVAASIWGISENAALKRVKRIGAKGLDGRWYVRRSAVKP